MHWLWLSKQCWESNPDLNVDKYSKNLLWTIQIIHHVASATNMCARMFKGWYCQCKVGSRTVGCCEHIAAVLILAIRDNRWVKFCLSEWETDYFRILNVLDAADTIWNFKCRVNKSLYARRVSDFSYKSTKVHHHLFHYFS